MARKWMEAVERATTPAGCVWNVAKAFCSLGFSGRTRWDIAAAGDQDRGGAPVSKQTRGNRSRGVTAVAHHGASRRAYRGVRGARTDPAISGVRTDHSAYSPPATRQSRRVN